MWACVLILIQWKHSPKLHPLVQIWSKTQGFKKIIQKSVGDITVYLCLFAAMFIIYNPYYFVTTNRCRAPLLAMNICCERLQIRLQTQTCCCIHFHSLQLKSQQNVLLLIPCCVFACQHFYSEMCNWGLGLNINEKSCSAPSINVNSGYLVFFMHDGKCLNLPWDQLVQICDELRIWVIILNILFSTAAVIHFHKHTHKYTNPDTHNEWYCCRVSINTSG